MTAKADREHDKPSPGPIDGWQDRDRLPFADALRHARSGEFQRAHTICQQILAGSPDNIDALHLSGLVLCQTGSLAAGLERLLRATTLNDRIPVLHYNLAQALHAANRPEEAIDHYRMAVDLAPDFADAQANLGNICLLLGRHSEAAAALHRAVAALPNNAALHGALAEALRRLGHLDDAVHHGRRASELAPNLAMPQANLGNLLLQLERFDEAAAAYECALRLAPNDIVTRNNRGVTLQELGRYDEAVNEYQHVLTLNPSYVEAHNNLGNALCKQSKPEAAIGCYRRAIALQPDYAPAYNNLGIIFLDQEEFDEAAQCFSRSIRLNFNNTDAHSNLGIALRGQGYLEQAIASYRQALALNPSISGIHNNLGVALRERGAPEEAKASFERALALDPNQPDTLANLGSLLREQGCLDQAIAAEKAALRLHPGLPLAEAELIHAQTLACDWAGIETWATRLLGAAKTPRMVSPFFLLPHDASPEAHLFCTKQWIGERRQPICMPARVSGRDKLRLCYLSAGFCDDVVGLLLPGLIERHDRQRFEVLAYCYGRQDDGETRGRLRAAFDKFTDIAALGTNDAAQQIHADGVDILIDLMGYTQQSRPGILALRPAPIQVNYLGYPGTMGAEFMDYIIVDPWIVPFREQPFYAEQLVQLPECYQPSDVHRRLARIPSRAECGLPTEGFVFCCFNNSYKIRPPFFDIWMRLLDQVPNSVLWLIKGHSLVEENLTRAAVARGVAPERLRFSERVPTPEYVARLSLADLFLDTLPYNAGATANDALWAGLPVLTCTGDTYTGRMAGSLLRAAGLPELVVSSLAEYEALALRLATEPTLLAMLRGRLSRNRSVEPLFDMARYTQHLERAYRQMWDIRQSGALPTSFTVEALPRKVLLEGG